MRAILGTFLGLAIGAIGAFLFLKSLPPKKGSAEERAERAEYQLKQAHEEIQDLETQIDTPKPGNTTSGRMRSIAEDLKAGRKVDLDDVFKALKPTMRDLGPLFNRIREIEMEDRFDSLAGNLSRQYDLSPAEEKRLKAWFKKKAEENARAFMEVINSDSSRAIDFVLATKDFSENVDGLDQFMEDVLDGEQLAAYQEQRMEERVSQVQAEADRNVVRLDNIVELEEDQKDQIFSLMARSSDHFDPAMTFEGLDDNAKPLVPGQSREASILQVLTPQQQLKFEAHRQEERTQAERELGRLGLSLPDNWDLFEQGSW